MIGALHLVVLEKVVQIVVLTVCLISVL